MANVEEIAWLAGLLEGDGSFQLQKNGPTTRIPRIVLSMLDFDVVERISKIFGSNITKDKTPKGKTMFKTAIARTLVVEPLLKELYPHMGLRRKEQINKMLNWYNIRRNDLE